VNYDKIFNDFFIANVLLSVMVKEFWRSVRIRQSYGKKSSGTFFPDTVYIRCTLYSTKPKAFRNEMIGKRDKFRGDSDKRTASVGAEVTVTIGLTYTLVFSHKKTGLTIFFEFA